MRVEEPEVLEVFRECNAIKNGHFIIGEGLHTNVRVEDEEVMSYIVKAFSLCYGIAERFADDGVEMVVGLGGYGAVLAPWTAQNVSNITEQKVLGISAEEVSDDLVGKNVLVVDGVLATGDVARKVITAVREVGGNVIGFGALWNSGGITPQDVDVPKIHALVNIKIYAWTKEQCPHCELGIPITDVGGKIIT